MKLKPVFCVILFILVSQRSTFGQCNPMPIADFSVAGFCETDSAIFVNLSQNADTYLWKFGDGKTSTKYSPKHFYHRHHLDNVTLVARSSNGCADSITKPSIMHQNPKSEFTYTQYHNVLYLNANALGSTSYSWHFSNGDSLSTSRVSYSYSKPTKETVCLKVINAAGCFSKTCLPISIKCNAKFTKTGDTSLKFKIFLTNNSFNLSTTQYQWDFGDGGTSSSKTPIHKYNTFGKFKVCLTLIDSGCSSTFCDTIGMDSTGKLFKSGSFEIVVMDEMLSAPTKDPKIDFTMYPNPANNIVTIDLRNSLSIYNKLEVIDAIGQVSLMQPIESGEKILELDLQLLNSGIYLVRLSNHKDRSYLKMIKL